MHNILKQSIVFLFCLLFIFSCKTQSKQTEETTQNKDSSLKTLVIRHGNEELRLLSSPVEKSVRIQLEKDVDANNYIEVIATPTDAKAKITFDNENHSDNTKKYNTFVANVNIKVENGSSTSQYKITFLPKEKKAILETLVIKQGAKTLASYNRPIDQSIDVYFSKTITSADFIEVTAIPFDLSSQVKIDGEETKTKQYISLPTKDIEIIVTKGDVSNTYKLTLKEIALESLVIKQETETIITYNKPIAQSISVGVNKKITSADFVEVIVTPTDASAKVEIDGEETKTKQYSRLPIGEIKIIVTKGDASNTHTLTLKEPDVPPLKPTPIPTPPPTTPTIPTPEASPPSGCTVKFNVMDAIGGVNVEGVEIKANEVGGSAVIETKTTDENGNAYFNLAVGKCYDFVLAKNGRAGSTVENVFVKSNNIKYLSIPMREWAVGAKAIAPRIGKVDIFNNQTSDSKTIGEGTEIDMSEMTLSHYLRLATTSLSGEIIPFESDGSGNFRISMNIDSSFSGNEGWGKITPTKFKYDNGEYVLEGSDGSLMQTWDFSLGAIMVPQGEATLHFICYDQAGNRCERQERVIFKNGTINNGVNTKNRFEMFQAFSKRYYRSLKLFGMPNEMNESNSLNVVFYFKFDERIVAERVDVLRRPYENGNITANWKKVYTKQYKRGYQGDEYIGKKGIFRLRDDSGDLQEGGTYQYKLIAYTKDGKLESDVATLRMMEAFNVLLTSPEPRETIKLKEITKKDFSFKISDATLWDARKADYFSFDVLISTDMTGGEGSSAGLCFASKLKYLLYGDEEKRLYIGDEKNQYRLFSELVDPSYKISDLITYKDGLITLKNKFMNIEDLNLQKTSIKYSIQSGGMYYWDVQSFAGKYGEDALSSANRAAFFAKQYPYLDSKTGLEKPDTEWAVSYSYANLDAGSGAVNGRSLFIVVEKE
ncbi:MAG: dentilisin complex subunit PrcA [Treponema sp.]